MEALIPFMRLVGEVATEAGRTVYNEAVAPEMHVSPQQERAKLRSGYTQAELLALAFVHIDQELLEAQSPRGIFTRLFELDPQIHDDAAHLAQVRQNIWDMNHPAYVPGQSLTMDSGDFMREQGAVAIPQTEISVPPAPVVTAPGA